MAWTQEEEHEYLKSPYKKYSIGIPYMLWIDVEAKDEYEAEELAKQTGIDFLVVKSDRFKKDDPHMPDKKWLPEDFVKRMGL